MSQLPILSSNEILSVLIRIGYSVVRQRGSHMRLQHNDSNTYHPITVPAYKEIDRSLLRKILRDIPMSVDDFLKWYKEI